MNQFQVTVIEHYNPNSELYPSSITWRATNIEFPLDLARIDLIRNPALIYVDINDGTCIYSVRRNA